MYGYTTSFRQKNSNFYRSTMTVRQVGKNGIICECDDGAEFQIMIHNGKPKISSIVGRSLTPSEKRCGIKRAFAILAKKEL